MKTSELISRLQALQEEHGDLDVLVADDRWPEEIGDVDHWPLVQSKKLGDGSSGWGFLGDVARGIYSGEPRDAIIIGRHSWI